MLIWMVLAAGLGVGLVRVFAGYPAPATPCRILSRRECATIGACADALFPSGGAIPPSGREAGVPAYTDRYLGVLPRPLRILMRMLFFLVEHATLFFPAPGRGGFRRFSSLSEPQRVAVLESWRSSRLFLRRLVFTSLRAILTMGYFADPAVARGVGLAPYAITPPRCEADLLYPRVGEHPETIPWTREDLTPPSDGTPIPLDAPLHPDYVEKRA